VAEFVDYPSPNHGERNPPAPPKLVILHYTGMKDGPSALQRLCDPASKVSAHYLVEEDGRIFRLVPEDRRAWHAGKSCWQGIEDINSCSIGIEVVNPGHEWGYRLFPLPQMQAVLGLCREIKNRYKLPASAFLAHSDIAPLRKEDPGELFDWEMLAKEGIGLGVDISGQPEVEMSVEEAAQKLQSFGYMPFDKLVFSKVLAAFQRHFVRQHVTGELDSLTKKALRALCG
jgi:N-acetylmuramoyl-L-alanine amidase